MTTFYGYPIFCTMFGTKAEEFSVSRESSLVFYYRLYTCSCLRETLPSLTPALLAKASSVDSLMVCSWRDVNEHLLSVRVPNQWKFMSSLRYVWSRKKSDGQDLWLTTGMMHMCVYICVCKCKHIPTISCAYMHYISLYIAYMCVHSIYTVVFKVVCFLEYCM